MPHLLPTSSVLQFKSWLKDNLFQLSVLEWTEEDKKTQYKWKVYCYNLDGRSGLMLHERPSESLEFIFSLVVTKYYSQRYNDALVSCGLVSTAERSL